MNNNEGKNNPQRQRNDHSRQNLEAIRLTAVKRVLVDGEAPTQVIEELGFHRSCIYEWLNIYKQKGEAGLLAKPISGRPALNSKKQKHVQIANKCKDSASAFPDHSDISQWVVILYESLLNFQYPLSAFISALNHCLEGTTIIVPDLHTPSSPMRAFYSTADLHTTISQNTFITSTWHANPFLKALTKPGDIFTLDEIISPDAWQENEYCLALLQRAGNQKVPALGFCFAGPNETLCGLFCTGTIGKKVFSKQDKQLLQQLRVHLETAINLAISHWHSTYTTQALAEAIDNLETAVLILDGNGKMITCSAAAQEMLEQKKYFSLANQRIDFHNQDRQTQFEQAVNQAIAWRQVPIGNKPIEAMRFHQPSGGGIGVLVQPITPPSMVVPHSITVTPHVIVYINDPEKPRSAPQHQLIMRLFNLSTREAYLTTLLINGHALNEASKMMNITQATARTYLQHIYEKVGVNRRQELVQQVMKSVAVLA